MSKVKVGGRASRWRAGWPVTQKTKIHKIKKRTRPQGTGSQRHETSQNVCCKGQTKVVGIVNGRHINYAQWGTRLGNISAAGTTSTGAPIYPLSHIRQAANSRHLVWTKEKEGKPGCQPVLSTGSTPGCQPVLSTFSARGDGLHARPTEIQLGACLQNGLC